MVVGDSKVEDPNDPSKDVKEAFLWEGGVMTGLGFLEDPTVKFESVATAVSDDGLVVAGQSKVTDPNNAGKGVKHLKKALTRDFDSHRSLSIYNVLILGAVTLMAKIVELFFINVSPFWGGILTL